MANRFIFTLLFLAFCFLANAQKGFEVKVKLSDYPHQTIILGNHFGDKTYVMDTVSIGQDGMFTFKADTLLRCGIYLLVLQPDNEFVQLLMADDQQFTMEADAKRPAETMKITGSDDNAAFYGYMKQLAQLRPEGDSLQAQYGRLKGNPADSVRIIKALGQLDERARQMQLDIVKKYPNTMSAKIIGGAIEPAIPEFTDTDPKELQMKRYQWYRAHYFDNIDIADECFLRSPMLHEKVDNYMHKLVPQHPDSVNVEMDKLLTKMKGTENFRYFLSNFLNEYAQMKLVGFDACYVHLVKNYFDKGLAPWVEAESLKKMHEDAARIEPLLIGKIAPNLVVKDRKDQPKALYDVDADYTVLFFWAPDCSHCKKSAPFMVEFAEKFKSKGVKIFAICTAVTDKGPECWKGVEEKGFNDNLFLNTYDPYIQSRYKTLYDVVTTPQIYILDRKHEILMKKIAAEDLIKTMEQVIEIQKNKKS